jgi:tetratricopeptide (TPR) repeat protein
MTRQSPARPRLVLAAAALALAFEAVPGTAWAADAPSPQASPSQSAEKLAEKAYELHGQGKFAEAIATYLQAYAISNAAAVLFNIAMIYDHKLHEPALAADYYRRYLGASDVEPDLAQKANARLAALKQAAEDEAKAREIAAPPPPQPEVASPPPPPPPVSPPPPPAQAGGTGSAGSRGSGLRTTGVVVGVAGVAGLGASAVLAILAKGKNDDANALCDGAACSNEQGVMLAHDAGTFATASTVAFVAGAALAACGVVLYLAAPRGPAPATAWLLAPAVERAGGGLSVRAVF